MGSRLKQNPERTFNWFFEATCPVARDKDPGVKFQFPEDFKDEESSQTLPRFCFPYDIQRPKDSVTVQHFTFVLTDLEGCQRFGFCRLTNSTQTCLCILSYLPWFEVFYKLLNNLADYLSKGQINEIKALLAALYQQSIPLALGSVTLQMGEQILMYTEVSRPVGHKGGQEGIPYFIAPDPRSLPSIPENRNLTELIVAVDVGNLLQLYASMLFERRVLIFASKLSTLTSCVHALSAVLYPMYWQHIFIPVLPPHLLDYCCAPMPYLIGVHSSLSERVRSRGLEEVVILNVDTNTLETPFDDLKRIPSNVMSGLKVCLKRQAVSPGCGVSRAFLKAQALLFGGYREALQGDKEGKIHFSEECFLDHKSASMKQFLQSAIHLQFFKQFIDDRLDVLNKGKGPDDLFEEEITKCETAAGRGKSYQQLVGNLKKGGGALILNMKTKANMKTKVLSKSGLKNLLSHKVHPEDHNLHRGGSMSHRRAQSDSLQSRLPITQHFGRSRPRRPVQKHKDNEITKDPEDLWDSEVLEPTGQPDPGLLKEEEEGDNSPLCDPEEMDLLGEIFDTLSSRSSHERGLLYGTRSLDLFGPDSHDYIIKHVPANPSQESLLLSISGSGSLHSWNLETTEELSDRTEDSDWHCLDTSLLEEEGAECLLVASDVAEHEVREKENREIEKEKIGEVNGKQEINYTNKCMEVKVEEERSIEDPENMACFEKSSVKEMTEGTEDERIKNTRKDDEIQSGEALVQEEGKKRCDTQENETEEEIIETQNEKNNDSKETLKCINRDDPIFNSVKEQQGEATVTPGPVTADPKPPLSQEKKSENTPIKEQGVCLTSPPPKVLSALARFQGQPYSQQGFQLRSISKNSAEAAFRSREKLQTPCDSDTNQSSEAPEEEDHPPVKVSELKKRFEA
ncbi:DENN domain-containing protein 1C isoform X1 [Girardinichthys multiradiatus]|uniref:DENN domain-containing protein 1C isoform X1 n=1 Tax=Girardinichthys multiradiatus TaxID=208333 RepID=UPI001FAD9902|nr:DENN domain-containing protein 1C isoform X1 [Girardinichthys multiradiatus]